MGELKEKFISIDQLITKGTWDLLLVFIKVIVCFQVLKLYAWEESFMKEVERKRKKELKYLRGSSFWMSGFMFTFGCAPTLVSC